MDGAFHGLAEAQARLYFLDLVALLRDLHGAYVAVARAFSSLLLEYDGFAPRSRLRLYPRYSSTHQPRALYWGRLFTLRLAHAGQSTTPKRKAIGHLKGRFKVEWTFTLAKRSDLQDRFLDFDRRRLALNAACRAVSRGFRWLEKATIRKFPRESSPLHIPSGLDPGARWEVPETPRDLLPRDLPPSLRVALGSGWVAAFMLGVAEEELSDLGMQVKGNPSIRGLRLELADQNGDQFLRPAWWIHEPSGKSFPKLTDRLMRQLHVKEGARPVLSLKERKRRRIAKGQAFVAQTLDSVREKCSEVHMEVTRHLAESAVILLPGERSLPPQRAAV